MSPKTKKGDPVAEARIQSEQSFTHLKIIKSSEGKDLLDEPGATLAAAGEEPKRRKNARIYSQVAYIHLRLLKVCF